MRQRVLALKSGSALSGSVLGRRGSSLSRHLICRHTTSAGGKSMALAASQPYVHVRICIQILCIAGLHAHHLVSNMGRPACQTSSGHDRRLFSGRFMNSMLLCIHTQKYSARMMHTVRGKHRQEPQPAAMTRVTGGFDGRCWKLMLEPCPRVTRVNSPAGIMQACASWGPGVSTMRLTSLMACPKVVPWKPVVRNDSIIPSKSRPWLKSHPLMTGVSGSASVGIKTACKQARADTCDQHALPGLSLEFWTTWTLKFSTSITHSTSFYLFLALSYACKARPESLHMSG